MISQESIEVVLGRHEDAGGSKVRGQRPGDGEVGRDRGVASEEVGRGGGRGELTVRESGGVGRGGSLVLGVRGAGDGVRSVCLGRGLGGGGSLISAGGLSGGGRGIGGGSGGLFLPLALQRLLCGSLLAARQISAEWELSCVP